MSYRKAMKHARNVRKCRKQRKMYFGFDTGSGRWPSSRSNPIFAAELDIREWFKWRNLYNEPEKRQHSRDCIRSRITELRQLRGNLF